MRPDPAPAMSILCPAYRTEAYIGQAIDSVLAQTTDDWELVVVDNGLSDAIRDIVESYDDPRIRLLRQPNNGMDGGFAAAAAAATGRYFLVFCSDDLLTPDACALLTGVLDRYPHVDAVTGDTYVFDETRELVRPRSLRTLTGRWRRPSPRRPVTFAEVLGGRALFSGGALRREAWQSVGGFRAGDASDLALWLALLRTGHDVRELPDKIGILRAWSGSTSRGGDRQSYADGLVRVLAEAVDGTSDPALRRVMDRRVRYIRYQAELAMARSALRAGDIDDARRRARAALRQGRTARAAVVVAGLTIAPGMLRRVHPVRQDLTAAAQRAVGRLIGVGRWAGGIRPGRSPSGPK